MLSSLLSSVTSPYSFEICDTSGHEFAPYEHGGIAKQVKVSKMASFVSYTEFILALLSSVSSRFQECRVGRNVELLIPEMAYLVLKFSVLQIFYSVFPVNVGFVY